MAGRNFVRKDFSDIKDHRARELFELYEDLRYFEWEQDYSVGNVPERVYVNAIRSTMGVVHEKAMNLEWPDRED